MKNRSVVVWLLFAFAVVNTYQFLPTSQASAFSGGTQGWCGGLPPVGSGRVGCSSSAAGACAMQFAEWAWSDATNVGYTIKENWNTATCDWVRGSSGGPAGSLVYFTCANGYSPLPGGICVLQNENSPIVDAKESENSCGAAGNSNNGGNAAPRTGLPIDVSSGAKLFRVEDFRTADQSLSLERLYNSRSFSGTRNDMLNAPIGLGVNWRFAFQHELQLGTNSPSSAFRLELETAGGGSYPFIEGVAGKMDPDFWVYGPRKQTDYQLEFVGTWPADPWTILAASSQWTMRDPQDRVWTFQTVQDPASGVYRVGRPIAVSFRGGLQWTLTYGAYGNLTSIQDSYGKTITFTWLLRDLAAIGGTGIYPVAISTATLPDTTKFRYIYDSSASGSYSFEAADRLIAVEHLDASNNVLDATSYLYENADLPFQVTGIKDAVGTRRWTVDYDTEGRATSSRGPDNAFGTSVAYGVVGSPSYTRTVTNALNKSTVYNFNFAAFDIHLDSIDGIASPNCPASTKTYGYTNYFISSVTDEEGRVTQYTRNGAGQATQIVDGYGTANARTTSITWHSTLHVPTHIVQPNLTTDYTWNSSGQLTQVTQTDITTQTTPYSTNGQTRTWTFTYNTYGYLLTANGPLSGTGDTVTYTYDSSGYIASVTNEVGQTLTVSAVNGRGSPTTVVDPNGVTSSLTYDAEGRIKSITTDPSGLAAATAFDYSVVGDITKITRPNGAYLQYTYDTARRLTKVADNLGGSIEFDRDNLDNPTRRRIKNAGGTIQLSQKATFDQLGRLLTFVGAVSQTWTNAYDKTNNLLSVTDPRSNVYQQSFDSLNRLISETDEGGGVVTLTRDGQDQITNYNDPRSLNTSYVRNGFGDIIQRTSPDTGTTIYTYNALGKPTQITDGRSVVTNLTYDNAGRLLTKQYPASTGENITYTWDSTAGGNKGVGRITKIDDASGSIEWTYNVLGQATQEKKTTASVVYTIGYAYDLDGNVTQITYPSGRTASYARGSTGLITGVNTKKDTGSASVTLASSVAYQPFGPLASLAYGNGLTLSATFTQDYLINALRVRDPSTSAFVLNRTHLFADGFNLTAIVNGTTEATPPASAVTSTYNYPGTNNRLATVTQGAATVRSFTHDGGGNITADTRGSTVYNYRYNNRARLDRLTIGATVTADYTYDALERMAIRTTQNMSLAGTTHYLYDRQGQLLVEADNTGQTLREYVWLDDMPLAVVSGVNTGSPSLYYVHADHLNTPVKMTDASKAVVWSAAYWPFGSSFSITGSASNNLRFPGQYFLIEDGLHYNWHRHYDPTIGRYAQPDPLGLIDGPNLYAYVGSAPTQAFDDVGLETIVTIWNPVGRGKSAFGHVSTNVNGRNYSFGSGGWDTNPSADVYNEKNMDFRGGKGYLLNLTPKEEQEVEACLAGKKQAYSLFSNNCGHPIQQCLPSRAGNFGNRILPKFLQKDLLQSPALVTPIFYNQRRRL